MTLTQHIALAKSLCPQDNPEYLRGISELLALIHPTEDTDTETRAQEIQELIA